MGIRKMIVMLNDFIDVWELEQADEDMQMTIYKGDIEVFKGVIEALEKQIPIAIAKFLATPDIKGFAMHDKFAYLIKSADGDDYYFCEQLPEDGLISVELGDKLYELVSNTDYEEIFKWYKMWSDCI